MIIRYDRHGGDPARRHRDVGYFVLPRIASSQSLVLPGLCFRPMKYDLMLKVQASGWHTPHLFHSKFLLLRVRKQSVS